MSDRIKCDRCGEWHDPFHGGTFQRHVSCTDKKWKLCYECADELEEWLEGESNTDTDEIPF